ncbi:MAG TPA: response regulator transcription factor [Chloroflexota bacterium]|jgi:DNA-binding response OmpR family regulator|nr:response regulator transcription factor [Chloroflexota bacterium]
MKVLVVEDDRRLAALIARVLGKEGMAVDQAYEAVTGLELLGRGAYDVAIVDWMLPDRDGPSICRAVRALRLPTALLMLTARREVEDRVAGLESGADDYLGKPFAFEELLARVRALGRRFALVSGEGEALRSGDVVMDLRLHLARRGEHALDLTPTEWNLLECFMRHPGQALTRDQILDRAWSFDRDVLPTMVDVYVSYLRRKLRAAGTGDPIETVRGVGYRLAAPAPGADRGAA